MPIDLRIEKRKDVELAIWKMAEPSAYFESKLTIHTPEAQIMDKLSVRKRQEWLASRYLLHIMSGRAIRGEFVKDIHGKPHLQDSDYHISISHSGDRIAVIASVVSVGIDIQNYVSKITRIQHKFVSKLEAEMIDGPDIVRGLHIIWGAKESLYKAYGKRALDFIKHMRITALDLSAQDGHCHGVIHKGDYHKAYDITYHSFEKYMLVYATEIS